MKLVFANQLRGVAALYIAPSGIVRATAMWLGELFRELNDMRLVFYKRHRFPPEVIRQAVWLYFRFPLSLRDVEDLMAERGIVVSYEKLRCSTRKFGRQFARNLRSMRPQPTGMQHPDEMIIRTDGKPLASPDLGAPHSR